MPRIIATEKRSFDVLEEGPYDFVIVKADDRSGKDEPHNPYIHMQMQEPISKKNVFTNLVFTEKTARRVTNFWRALGNEVKVGEPLDFNAVDVQGRSVRAYVSISLYNGDKQNDVEYFIEPDEIGFKKSVPPPAPTTKTVQPF
jgi:hypothetical protein